ncbi:MAG TPA: DUF3551 domain-containing protein [Xanthobacteraceae bacterium]|jgi:hypothetical protein
MSTISLRLSRAAWIALAACIATAMDAHPSLAYINRPWCVQYTGRGSSENCGFVSYQQCMMTAGPGTGGYCVQNPWYLWYGPGGSATVGQGGRVHKRARR